MDSSFSIPIPENLLKSRSGPVLSRQMILKTDHFYTGINNNLDHLILGAPNFRGTDLNIYGVAQPAVHGLHTILHVLHCSPWTRTESSTRCIWISTREEPLVYINDRPFVLRDESSPFSNIHFYSGIRPTRLESMEERLKEDILSEGKKSNGLIVVHDEREEGKLVPCIVAIDRVQTPREVYNSLRKEGYHVEYHRIPVSPEQSPSEEYLDSVVDIIRKVNISQPIVFNCGMGLGRTTHAMILGFLIKRHLLLESGKPSTDSLARISQQIPNVSSQTERRDLLKLIFVLEQGLKRSSRSAIEWALERGNILDNLHAASKGNYHIINRLCSVLRMGYEIKRLVDDTIDKCSLLLNIRDNILIQRVRYFVANESNALQTGLTSIERYFSLIVFASFLESIRSKWGSYCFSSWIKERTEIWSMFQFVRTSMNKIQLFRPIDDLSSLALPHDKNMILTSRVMDVKNNDMNDSFAEEYTKNRSGSVLGPCMILKIDQWYAASASQPPVIESHVFSVSGAFHFRKMQGLSIYGVAQPTMDGIEAILGAILDEVNAASFSVSSLSLNEQDMTTTAFHHSATCPSLIWLNLREEPIVYIRGIPFVLRDQYATLRNIKSYNGISSDRLEALEERLIEDVKCEIHTCEGRLLLHEEEIQTGKIIPKWEEIHLDDVMTVRQLYEKTINPIWESLSYYRVPITAEEAPEFTEFDSIFNILTVNNGNLSPHIVINCQMGAGRSSMGMVICAMIMKRLGELKNNECSDNALSSGESNTEQMPDMTPSSTFEYHVIRSLLRVTGHGIRAKARVDELIDMASLPMSRVNNEPTDADDELNINNLRDSIECYRRLAESCTDINAKQRAIKKGLHQLKRYFLLVAFQAWLFQLESMDKNLEIFSTWIHKRPEIIHMIKSQLEVSPPSIDSLTPEMQHGRKSLVCMDDHHSMTKKMDTSPELVRFVLNRRNDSVLASQMILKSDHFPGCYIPKLQYKIEGAPNYRELSLYYDEETNHQFFGMYMDFATLSERVFNKGKFKRKKYIYGMAVPSVPALCNLIKNVLSVRKELTPSNRRIIWTSLREEPVLYINGLPYVLRALSMPWSNLETTGIARERVEWMEVKMKQGALRELSRYDGQLLLHEEVISHDDKPVLSPFWEKVSEDQVLTPYDVYFSISRDGYDLDYLRLPITDEQAPIPLIFDALYERYFNTDTKCDYLFNCQMGRGRTTTAMVASCLIEVICHGAKMDEPMPGYIENNISGKAKLYYHHAYLEKSSEFVGNIEDMEMYLRGEYKIILQLVQILEYGLMAKKIADICIDACDYIQNLREAIYEYKVRVDRQKKTSVEFHGYNEPKTILYSSLFKRGLNYLIRYFYLIVFANYLIDTCHHSSNVSIKYFSLWLDERKEILYLSTLPDIDLS